jgi:hypothetical protein
MSDIYVAHLTLPDCRRRGRVVNTPASYSGRVGLKSRPEDQLSWLAFSVILLSTSMEMPGITLN